MPSRRLSPTARRFLAERIHSVMQLELVLLLARDRDAAWTAPAAARELRAPEAWVADQLVDLVAEGVARVPDGRPDVASFAVDGPWAAAVDEIAGQFAQRRTSIIRLIFAPASADVQSFSDAFRLRPGDDEEGR
jgi:hypothetical protein